MHWSSRLLGLRWTRTPRETLDWERENVTFVRESWARKLSLPLHRLPALTALVAPGTFLPGVPGVIAAEVAAPSRSRAESQQGGAGPRTTDHMDTARSTASTAPLLAFALLLLQLLLAPSIHRPG